ncbi:unnamed protein product, partial [Rotaria sordida]
QNTAKQNSRYCARCGENHRIDQCTATNDVLKCYNCKGNHLATSKECINYKEQEKRMQNLINQYSTQSKSTTAPDLYVLNEFPSLPNIFQRQQEHLHKGLFDEIINVIEVQHYIKWDQGRQLQDLIKKGFIECVDDDSITFEKNDYEEKLD